VGLLCAAIALISFTASDLAWAQNDASQMRSRSRAELEREMEARRQKIRERQAKNNLRVYYNKDGVPYFTNKPLGSSKKRSLSSGSSRSRGVSYVSKSDIEGYVRKYSRMYNVDEHLIYAVIRVESNFNRYAKSHKGATGLMQLIPGTARDMGVRNVFDPGQNIAGGTRYLAQQLRTFKGNLSMALAAYNAGPETVKKYKGIPPYKETRQYVADVTRYRRSFSSGHLDPAAFISSAARRKKPATKEQLLDAQASASTKGFYSKYYTIHFKSGLSQPADSVQEDGDYYYIGFKGRTRRISKASVESIAEPA
jgi:soluble lytic murein transglycosylase